MLPKQPGPSGRSGDASICQAAASTRTHDVALRNAPPHATPRDLVSVALTLATCIDALMVLGQKISKTDPAK